MSKFITVVTGGSPDVPTSTIYLNVDKIKKISSVCGRITTIYMTDSTIEKVRVTPAQIFKLISEAK